MKKAWPWVLGLAFFVSALPLPLRAAAETGMVEAVSEDGFEREVLKSSRPVLVDFWAVWCGPCHEYEPVLRKTAKDLAGKLKVVSVDVDADPGLPKLFSVMGIPTLLLFEGGNVVQRWEGAAPETDIRRVLKRLEKSGRTAVKKSPS